MQLLVWDRPLRLFHGLLVVLVALCVLSAFGLPPWGMRLHVLAGAGLCALLLFRLVWGVVGSETSRFASFVPSPATVLRHLRLLLSGRPPRSLGHNPAAAAMVLLLLTVLTLLATSGLLLLGGLEKLGPLAPLVPTSWVLPLQRPHQILGCLLPLLAAVHVAGVLLESRLSGEPLIAAMLHGRKEVAADTPPLAPPRWPAGRLLLGLALLVGIPALLLSGLPPLGWQPLALPPLYAKECGACHGPYHPSLLPAAAWGRVMSSLDSHFGEDASLSAMERQALTIWLQDHAAEQWQTMAAVAARPATLDDSRRITAAPWWQQRHRMKLPRGAGNCENCHRDAAEGLFRPWWRHDAD